MGSGRWKVEEKKKPKKKNFMDSLVNLFQIEIWGPPVLRQVADVPDWAAVSLKLKFNRRQRKLSRRGKQI